MQLHFSSFGNGPPLIILHGLYGQGNNWLTIANQLSINFTVYLVDQRNHGKSCHNPAHNYNEMAQDLLEFCTTQSLKSIFLIGHSMGGKTAITFALKYPGIVRKLVVVDISPYSYLDQNLFADQVNFHRKILDTFHNTPITTAKSRNEIEEFFAVKIENIFIRKFLLKNLKRSKKGIFYWQLNVDALSKNLEQIIDAAPPVKLGAHSSIPALFIRGGKSPYITDEEMRVIPDVFKNAHFITFGNAGHWLHIEETERFLGVVNEFIEN